MSHGLDLVGADATPPPRMGPVDRAMAAVNRFVEILSSIALVAASFVLTYSVVVRYFLKFPTDWQDEFSVFLIIGAVFMSAAAIQARRGHVAIEAVAAMLPPRANAVRVFIVDVASFAFCAFFAWKSWTLWHEAWVDDYHSGSTWAPPLWIPYGLMTAGMFLLTFQILLQVVDALRGRKTT